MGKDLKPAQLKAKSSRHLSPGRMLLGVKSDQQLLELFCAGRDDAFEVIHNRYRQLLVAYAARIMNGSRSDAEDVVQEVFARSYITLRGDSQIGALKPWLYRVVHNRCVDWLRRQVPTPVDLNVSAETGSVIGQSVGLSAAPAAAAAQREDLRELINDIGRLSGQQRSVLLLRELHGLTHDEVADVLGINVAASKMHLSRARNNLVKTSHARDAACEGIQQELEEAVDCGIRPSEHVRRHLWSCYSCKEYSNGLRGLDRQLKLLIPPQLAGFGSLGGLVSKLLGVGGTTSGGATAGSSIIGGLSTGKLATTAVCCAVITAGGTVQVAREVSDSQQAGTDQQSTNSRSDKPSNNQKVGTDRSAQERSELSPSGTDTPPQLKAFERKVTKVPETIKSAGKPGSSESSSVSETPSEVGSDLDPKDSQEAPPAGKTPAVPVESSPGGGEKEPQQPSQQVVWQSPQPSPYPSDLIPGYVSIVGKRVKRNEPIPEGVAIVTRKLPLLVAQAGKAQKTNFKCPQKMTVAGFFTTSDYGTSRRLQQLRLDQAAYGKRRNTQLVYSPFRKLQADTSIVAGVLCKASPKLMQEEQVNAKRLKVCSKNALLVYRKLKDGYPYGLLFKDQTFALVRRDGSGRWGYGFAGGDTEAYGWVPLAGLCGRQRLQLPKKKGMVSFLERRTICFSREYLKEKPGLIFAGSLSKGSDATVLRYSSKYAYIFSFEARRFGWVRRSALCRTQKL